MTGGLSLWGGVECSVVRVRDRYVDQSELTGHATRLGDLERIAALGVRALRYPVLWERVMPVRGRPPSWDWTDERLGRLRELGIRPIVGLVHHGSGPLHTSLLEDSFVSGLADFAQRVAERYPWVTDYTPVNEPLTTARFSALYGHWYPHRTDDASFARALVVECTAIRAAMKAIRAVRPDARLVQTEDLGTIFATTELAYQARFENERRFLSLDLLTGRVDTEHPLRAYLVKTGIAPETLDSFTADACPPDVIGLNHYVASDRFLDHRTDLYPPHVRGGNGRDRYADVEAVRVLGAGISGFRGLLELLWTRYRLPLAITEAHLGCTPEEQVRWLAEAWEHARSAREAGVEVLAVTVWSLFGATDWDSLLTNPRGHYEPGVFDVRGGVVRPTALAEVSLDLATRGRSDHPVLDEPGWWRRKERLLYPAVGRVIVEKPLRSPRPLLVIGAAGPLGQAIVDAARARGLETVALDHELDAQLPEQLTAALDALLPWAVVDADGFERVDDAERQVVACMRRNSECAAMLAEACHVRQIRLVTYSSDLVFDGHKGAPYTEEDVPDPLGVYGASKELAERLVAEAHPTAIVVRTGPLFGPADPPWARASVSEALLSPTYVPDLAAATLTLLVDGASGLWHLATPGETTWRALARRAAERVGLSPEAVLASARPRLAEDMAARPRYRVLQSRRGALLRPLDDALDAFAIDFANCATRSREAFEPRIIPSQAAAVRRRGHPAH